MMPTSRADACFHQDLIKKMHLKVISRVSLRKCEGKAAPQTQTGALSPDLTAHCLRQRLGDRQTDAGASKGARERFRQHFQLLQNPSLHPYVIYVIVFPYPPGMGMGMKNLSWEEKPLES
jgi:hypothetical protein